MFKPILTEAKLLIDFLEAKKQNTIWNFPFSKLNFWRFWQMKPQMHSFFGVCKFLIHTDATSVLGAVWAYHNIDQNQ